MSLTNTTALLRPSTGCAESSGTRGVHTTARRKQGEYVQGIVCIRCRAQRSVRIDARNGDRLGGGGYDYHDTGLPTQGWRAPDATGAVGIAAPWGPKPRAAPAPKRAPTTGWLGSKSRLCACNSP
jgi:hypothetical protein